jgi:hypothetical protein
MNFTIKKFNEAVGTNKKLIVKKGYTLTVVSWENYGDNYNTKTMTVETVEEAETFYKLMQLCKSKNNGGLLGNSHDEYNARQLTALGDFFRENPAALKGFFKYNPDLDVTDIDDETYAEYFDDIKGDLLGYSEFYLCRVMDSCTVTYSPEDIYLDVIKF